MYNRWSASSARSSILASKVGKIAHLIQAECQEERWAEFWREIISQHAIVPNAWSCQPIRDSRVTNVTFGPRTPETGSFSALYPLPLLGLVVNNKSFHFFMYQFYLGNSICINTLYPMPCQIGRNGKEQIGWWTFGAVGEGSRGEDGWQGNICIWSIISWKKWLKGVLFSIYSLSSLPSSMTNYTPMPVKPWRLCKMRCIQIWRFWNWCCCSSWRMKETKRHPFPRRSKLKTNAFLKEMFLEDHWKHLYSRMQIRPISNLWKNTWRRRLHGVGWVSVAREFHPLGLSQISSGNWPKYFWDSCLWQNPPPKPSQKSQPISEKTSQTLLLVVIFTLFTTQRKWKINLIYRHSRYINKDSLTITNPPTRPLPSKSKWFLGMPRRMRQLPAQDPETSVLQSKKVSS